MLHAVQPGSPDPSKPPDPSGPDPRLPLVDRLATVDDRVVPRLQRWAAGLGSHRVLWALDRAVIPLMQRVAGRAADRIGHASQRLVVIEDRVAGGRPVSLATRHARPLLLVVGLLLLSGAAVHMDRYEDLRASGSDGLQEITEAGGAPNGGTTLAGGESVEVGPFVGDDIEQYVTSRQAALAGLSGDSIRVAVVSFDAPADGPTLDQMLADVEPLSIQFTNPQAAARPLSSEVEGSIASTVERAVGAVRTMAQEERDNAQALLDDGNVNDPGFLQDYERRVAEMDRLLGVLDDRPAIVFAAVVEGTVDALQQLADDPMVRLVDVAPAETNVADSGFWGLLPGDRDVATFGRS